MIPGLGCQQRLVMEMFRKNQTISDRSIWMWVFSGRRPMSYVKPILESLIKKKLLTTCGYGYYTLANSVNRDELWRSLEVFNRR